MIVSIVTPSYNQGKFIEETIQSVLSQKGNFLLEHVIVDGDSTDNSVETIKKYDALVREGKYPIRCNGIEYCCISEPDKGQSDAVNKGIRMAKGEIIGWLNSDDTYCDGALARVVKAFSENPSLEIVYGDCNSIDEQGNFLSDLSKVNSLSQRALESGYTVIQPETFFRKRLVDRIGYLDESLHFSMDYDFWIRAVKNDVPAKYVPHALANFRTQKNSKQSSLSLALHAEKLNVASRYFRLDRISLLFGNCCCDLSYRRGTLLEKTFFELKDAFRKQLRKNGRMQRIPEKFFQRALVQAHLKNGVYRASVDKRAGLFEAFYVLIHWPLFLISRDGLLLVLKLVLHSRILSILKNLQFFIFRKVRHVKWV